MLDIVRAHEATGISVVKVGSAFHVVRIDEARHQVKAVMKSDMGPMGEIPFGRACEAGVKATVAGRSRAAAVAGWKRAIAEYQW